MPLARGVRLIDYESMTEPHSVIGLAFQLAITDQSNMANETPSTLSRRDPETRRSLIIEAADALFGEEGYDAVSVSRVASRAGVAVGTLYLFFPDKAALLIGVINHRKSRIARKMRANMPRPGENLAESLRRLIPPVFQIMLEIGPLGGPVDGGKIEALGPEVLAAYNQVDDVIRDVFFVVHKNGFARPLHPQLMPKMVSSLVTSAVDSVLAGDTTEAEAEAELLDVLARVLATRSGQSE